LKVRKEEAHQRKNKEWTEIWHGTPLPRGTHVLDHNFQIAK